MTFKNLKYENLEKDADNFSPSGLESYFLSYHEFIKYFKNINVIEKHHLIISSHFVYGWMPKILKVNLEKEKEILEYLNAVKNGGSLNIDELRCLKSCINNSLVGVSKLLHFINPKEYAIWDSRVFRYLTNKRPYNYRLNEEHLYVKYLNQLKEIILNPKFENLYSKIENHFNYKITSLRAIEILMFETDRKNNQIKISQIFNEEPVDWGLRGDPHLWAELKEFLTNIEVPNSETDFEYIINEAIQKLTGKKLEPENNFWIERYNSGGMSGGTVCSDFWIDQAIPMLLERFKILKIKDGNIS